MPIEETAFGSITIDGAPYPHDVVIRLSGEIVKRKKKLSTKYYGSSHTISKDEAKFVFEKGCAVLAEPTLEALRVFNELKGRKIGLFQVTC